MSSTDINPEWKLVAIGRGSFATVSILSGRPVAFKHVIVSDHAPQLKAEFNAICFVYDFCNTDSFFAIPRPLAYYDPGVSASFVSQASLPPSTSTGRSRTRRPMVSEADFKALKLESAAYAMDQVFPIPLSAAQIIRGLFYPPGQEAARVPSLCRLYFGKVIETTTIAGRPSRFFNSANFPLDVSRYTHFQEDYGNDLPSVDEIARGMGEMLGYLHWRSGYDGRDIEFVIGGAGFSGIAMNVIDFNQVRPPFKPRFSDVKSFPKMRPWSRVNDDVHHLVDSFFSNDPYYPRPRSGSPLYQKFCLGYMATNLQVSKDVAELAETFLRAIEAEQAKRDALRT